VHELSVAESILEITLRHAASAGAARVTDLHLVIGDLSSVIDDSLRFYWDLISKGTPAEGANLHFKRIPITVECLDCGTRYEARRGDLRCVRCGGERIRIVAGREFLLEAIEVNGSRPAAQADARG